MKTSETISELANALAAAQSEFPVIEKSKTGKIRGTTKTGKAYEYDYKYADISDILKQILPILARHGLSLTQPTVVDGTTLLVRSRIMHKTGEWMESDYPVCTIQGDHQKMGGAMTYARRYGGGSLLGIATDQDVDGEHSATADLNGAKPDNNISPKQARELRELLDATASDEKKFCKYVKTDSIETIPAVNFAECKAVLENKLKEQAPEVDAA